jgi:hypothetical protein
MTRIKTGAKKTFFTTELKPDLPSTMNSSTSSDSCNPDKCSCAAGLDRRDFLKSTSLATLGLVLSRFPAIAGPADIP